MILVWDLLVQYVRDFEVANNTAFSDEAWQRIKQLETDLLNRQSEAEDVELVLTLPPGAKFTPVMPEDYESLKTTERRYQEVCANLQEAAAESGLVMEPAKNVDEEIIKALRKARLRYELVEHRDTQYRLERENSRLLYQTLAKHAPEALAAIKGQLRQNNSEPDKAIADRERENEALRRKVEIALNGLKFMCNSPASEAVDWALQTLHKMLEVKL